MKVPTTSEKEEKTEETEGPLKVVFNWVLRYPLALIGAFLVIVLASVLMFLGMGDRFNWGGIIGTLFGKKKPTREERANKIPDSRVYNEEDETQIPIGEADEEGYVQRPVEIIDHSSNPFRDKTEIEITTSEGKKKKIALPQGVEDTDVDKVIEIKPEVFEVKTKKRPSERVSDNDLDLLK